MSEVAPVLPPELHEKHEMHEQHEKPSVLFVCIHNAGRSQMAAAFNVTSSTSSTMLEEGIDISANVPKVLTVDAVAASDVVITMGCGDTCPIFPGTRYEDWQLADPAGQGLAAVRPIRDEIKIRVTELIESLGIPLATG